MKRWFILALASAGATAAPIDMALFEADDHDRDGYVDLVEVAASIDLQSRSTRSTPTATVACPATR